MLLVDKAAKALIGSKLDDAALEAAAAACSDACKPIDDKRGTIKYRTKIAGVLLKRAALIARDRINGIEHGDTGKPMAKIHVTTTINGAATEFLCEPNQTLLDVLRDTLGLTGSKEGCGSGDCGACSVTLNGRLVCSCLVLAPEAEGQKIETIEGMADGEKLHPLQKKFVEHGRAPVRHLHAGLPGRLQGAARARTRTRPRPRSATGWPATSAAAPATTRSSRAVMDVAAEMRGAANAA